MLAENASRPLSIMMKVRSKTFCRGLAEAVMLPALPLVLPADRRRWPSSPQIICNPQAEFLAAGSEFDSADKIRRGLELDRGVAGKNVLNRLADGGLLFFRHGNALHALAPAGCSEVSAAVIFVMAS
jgi:hypothetical protein